MSPIIHRRLSLWIAMVVLGGPLGCRSAAPPVADLAWDTAAWQQDLALWTAVRNDWVPSAFGPLAQVGLCRIDPAALPLALDHVSDGACRIPDVPAGAPVQLISQGDTLTVADPTAMFWVGPQPLRGGHVLALRDHPEVDGSQAWQGSRRWTARWADGAITLWLLDTLATARDSFAGITRWPADPAWRIAARFEPADAEWRSVPTVRGFELPREVAGTVHATIQGESRQLTAYSKGRGATSMLVVIRDATSGDGSYPAGRFVDVPLADSLGRTVLDFNLARNPDCAFTLSSPCPLPPRENWFTQRIEAGEMVYHPGS